MNDFTSFRVDQLKKALIDRGLSQNEVNGLKGKYAVVVKVIEMGIKPEDIEKDVEELVGQIEGLGDFEGEEIVAQVGPHDKVVVQLPPKHSPEWHDYIMSQFSEKELFNELPTINGLRRVARLVLGEPLITGARTIEVTHGKDIRDPGRATCVYDIVYEDADGIARTYSGVGGSYVGNTDDDYAGYPEAMAETRAESRALRKALGLNVNAAEEVANKPIRVQTESETESTGEWGEDQNATPQQIKLIEKMCGELVVDGRVIDVNKFINKQFHTGQTEKPRFENIGQVPRVVAAAMIAELNKYRTMTDVSKEIPTQILADV